MTVTTTFAGKAAVLEGMPEHPALKAILTSNPEALADAKFDRGELTLTITPEKSLPPPLSSRQPDTTSMVLNMGPQHPSTHGVLRLVLELDGETSSLPPRHRLSAHRHRKGIRGQELPAGGHR
jgi:hypothetical protein